MQSWPICGKYLIGIILTSIASVIISSEANVEVP